MGGGGGREGRGETNKSLERRVKLSGTGENRFELRGSRGRSWDILSRPFVSPVRLMRCSGRLTRAPGGGRLQACYHAGSRVDAFVSTARIKPLRRNKIEKKKDQALNTK